MLLPSQYLPMLEYSITLQQFLTWYLCRRRPAWTDRILSRVNTYNYENENVELSLEAKNYRSHPDEIYRYALWITLDYSKNG